MIQKFADLPDGVFRVISKDYSGVLSKDGLVLRKQKPIESTLLAEMLQKLALRSILGELGIPILEGG